MDSRQSPVNDSLGLVVHGVSIPIPSTGNVSSRPSSARSNRSVKEPKTPSRQGSARGSEPHSRASVNLSSARQRRLSSSSRTSAGARTPPADIAKSRSESTASSISSARNQNRNSLSAFFTDQSVDRKDENNYDTKETNGLNNDDHQLDSVFIHQHENHDILPLGMSKDSLGGTIPIKDLAQSGHSLHEQPHSLDGSVVCEGQNDPHSDATREDDAASKIQRWYREKVVKRKQSSFERKPSISSLQNEPIPNKPASIPRTPTNNSRASSRRPSSVSSNASKRQITPRASPMLPSSTSSSASKRQTTPRASPISPRSSIRDRVPSVKSVHSSSPSTASSSSTLKSKITANDVYEAIKHIETVESSLIEPKFDDDLIYVINPNADLPSPLIDKFSRQLSNPSGASSARSSIFKPDESLSDSVQLQKSGSRAPSVSSSALVLQSHSPISGPTNTTRLIQSATESHIREIPTTDDQVWTESKTKKPYKSVEIPNNTSNIQYNSSAMENGTQQKVRRQHDFTRSYRQTREEDFDYQLQKQKDDYENIIQRHLKFIDQLIDDKRKLSQRCEILVLELKSIDKKYNDRIRALDESHTNELRNLKNIHEAAEKLRREQWVEEKTRKLKEATVRGLEPEIQKLINKHKNEIGKMKTIHEAELLEADERAAKRYIHMIDELRDQLEREKQVAIADERELARTTYEKSLREMEQSFNEQRRQLYTEMDEEKTRQMELVTKQHADLDKLRNDIEENHRTVISSTKLEYESMHLEQERRHSNDIEELKAKLTLENQNWQNEYIRQQEITFANRERELREQMKSERDREIERIISQLESDTTVTTEETMRTAENRVKFFKEKYESDIRQLEDSEKQMKGRYIQTQSQLIEVQDELERLRNLLRQKETEINDIRKVTDVLQQERENVSDVVRQEFADRLVLTENENRRIKVEIAELRARQQLELEKKKEENSLLQRQQDKELATINEKIKEAVAKKDENVHALRVQYENSIRRIKQLEELLSQQRKSGSGVTSTRGNSLKRIQPS